MDKNVKQKICNKYLKGIRGIELSKQYNISPTSIYNILRKNNIQIRDCSRRKYQLLDENMLNKIDCEWKAYFLGLFMADGCVQKNKSLVISLTKKDEEILKCLSKFIFKKPKLFHIKKQQRKYKNGLIINSGEKTMLRINSEKIWKEIQKLGCNQKKSLTLKFPHHLPKKYMSHFIRGFFDGDGSFILPQTFSIISSNDFCSGLLKYFSDYQIKGAIHKTGKVSRFQVYKTDDLIKVYNFLYKGATIFLNRKYLRYTAFVKKANFKKKYEPKYSNSTGVSFDKRRNLWFAYADKKRKRVWLGSFGTEKEAIIARKRAEDRR